MSDKKVVLVTGGGKGIGREYCFALSKNGYRIAAADIDTAAVSEAVEQINAGGGEAIDISLNISDWSSVQSAVAKVMDSYGRIDVLVNNASLYAVIEKKPFLEISSEEWDRVISINLKGTFHCCKAVTPIMMKSGWGRIINISSSSVFMGIPGFLHYVSSKAAIIGMTRSLAREVGQYGITVNAVAPGLTRSGSNDNISDDYFDNSAKTRCIPRVQLPSDLTGLVLFLASDNSGFMTGQTLNVDGGAIFL